MSSPSAGGYCQHTYHMLGVLIDWLDDLQEEYIFYRNRAAKGQR